MGYEDQTMQQAYEQANLQGQGGDPNSLYADFMREEKVKNIIEQINPDKLVVDIENRIRGFKKDQHSKQWVKISNEKVVNETMIADLISYLGPILNDNTTFSNYSSGEINNIMEKVIEYLRDNLTDNDDKYEICGDFDEMTRIADIVCHTIFSALKRAQNGMEARRIFGALKVHESLTGSPPQRKGGFDFLKFWS